MVCDWSEADATGEGGALALPTCVKGTCPGHDAADVLPMRVEGSAMSNLEYYKYMSPMNSERAYVYDSFTWAHCEEEGVSFPS